MRALNYQCIVIIMIFFTSKIYSQGNDIKLQFEQWKQHQLVNAPDNRKIGENEIVVKMYNIYRHITKNVYQKGPGIYGYFDLLDKNSQKTSLGIKIPESRISDIVKFTISKQGKQNNLPTKFTNWLRRPKKPYLFDRLFGVDGYYGFVLSVDSLESGIYTLKFKVKYDGKTIINNSSFDYKIKVIKAKTQKQKEERILKFIDYKLYFYKEGVKGDILKLLEENKISDISLRMELCSNLSIIFEREKKIKEDIALLLLLTRLGQSPIILLSRIKMSSVDVLLMEKEIEKISTDMKNQYFGDVKYKYQPSECNLHRFIKAMIDSKNN